EGCRTSQKGFRAPYSRGTSSRGSRQAPRSWTPRNGGTPCSHRVGTYDSCEGTCRRGSEGPCRGARSFWYRATPRFLREAGLEAPSFRESFRINLPRSRGRLSQIIEDTCVIYLVGDFPAIAIGTRHQLPALACCVRSSTGVSRGPGPHTAFVAGGPEPQRR